LSKACSKDVLALLHATLTSIRMPFMAIEVHIPKYAFPPLGLHMKMQDRYNKPGRGIPRPDSERQCI